MKKICKKIITVFIIFAVCSFVFFSGPGICKSLHSFEKIRVPLDNIAVRQKKAQGEFLFRRHLLTHSPTKIVYVYSSATDGFSGKVVQVANKDGAGVTFETGRYHFEGEDHVCISSQIGCEMACSFCLSTRFFEYMPGRKARMLRSLDADEIVSQVQNALEVMPPEDSSKLVFAFMGMGEPFANIDNVKEAIIKLGTLYPTSRAVISTVGFDLDGIRKLADEVSAEKFPIPVKLHISLHASNNETRAKLMPKAQPIEDTIETAMYYARQSRTLVKLNYILIEGTNADDESAHEIGRKLQGKSRLILKISDFNSPSGKGVVSPENADRFVSLVQSHGVSAARFKSLGKDTCIRCGELSKGKMPINTILALVLNREGKYLAVKRSDNDLKYPGKWSMVSGTMENGESPENCLEREIREELHLSINVNVSFQGLLEFIYQEEGERWLVHPYICRIVDETKLKLNREHIEHKWVDLDELMNLDLAPPLIKELNIFLRALGISKLAMAEECNGSTAGVLGTLLTYSSACAI